jgi:ribonuclease BN (tRNA processing enzyme)
MAADIDLRIADEGRPDLRGLVTIRDIGDGPVATLGTIEVTALRNIHPPLTDTFALSFRGAAAHVVFSGDTAFHPPLADFAKGADLLIHEAMLLPAVDALVARVGNGDDRLRTHLIRSHTSAEDAGRIAAMAGVGALALHHLVPSDDPAFGHDDWTRAVRSTWDGPLHIGQDGLKIDLSTPQAE